jgi:hypothetical protein
MFLLNKKRKMRELVQPKMSLNREFLIWKERGRVCEIRDGRV